MPCHFRIDHARHLVVIEATGRVTGEDILELQANLFRDPAFDPRMPEICDFRGAELEMVLSPQIRAIAERPVGAIARGRRAIVVAEGFSYGLARMFEAYANMQGHPVEAFTDMGEALAWLGVASDGEV